jgi:hypothetical protein
VSDGQSGSRIYVRREESILNRVDRQRVKNAFHASETGVSESEQHSEAGWKSYNSRRRRRQSSYFPQVVAKTNSDANICASRNGETHREHELQEYKG